MDHMGVDTEYAVTSTRRLSHIVILLNLECIAAARTN